MPVMIPKDKESIWLDPAVESQALLRSLLIPYSADEMAIMNAADLK
jgi:putative SOS response-associated peptidase YedK